MESNCIFCRIVNRESEASFIYENHNILSFMDINPLTPGHALIITKQHYNSLLEAPDDLGKDFMEAIKNVSKLMMDNLGADGINIINSIGRSAGQTIFHFHVHIIPRFIGKSIGFQEWWFSRAGHWERKDLDKMAERILGKSKL